MDSHHYIPVSYTHLDVYKRQDLYSCRIWENKNWVGYEVFNKNLNIDEVIEQISLI